MPITDLRSLQDHLQEALEIEHATIPPYLCALYSIPEGSNHEAASVIRSVVMEEMLHMILVANVMNAVGRKPVLATPGFIKPYPGPLPHSDDSFSVELLPFSERALNIFLKIERPAKAGAPPQPDRFHTIGQFYEAIEEALTRLTDKLGPSKVFTGIEADQVPPGRWYYGGGGEVVPVSRSRVGPSGVEGSDRRGRGVGPHDLGWRQGAGARALFPIRRAAGAALFPARGYREVRALGSRPPRGLRRRRADAPQPAERRLPRPSGRFTGR